MKYHDSRSSDEDIPHLVPAYEVEGKEKEHLGAVSVVNGQDTRQ
jgi:hypothetical protein